MPITASDLKHQDLAGRLANVEGELLHRFDVSYDVKHVHAATRLDEVFTPHQRAAQLQHTLARHFLFLTVESAATCLRQSATVQQLVYAIVQRAGC